MRRAVRVVYIVSLADGDDRAVDTLLGAARRVRGALEAQFAGGSAALAASVVDLLLCGSCGAACICGELVGGCMVHGDPSGCLGCALRAS